LLYEVEEHQNVRWIAVTKRRMLNENLRKKLYKLTTGGGAYGTKSKPHRIMLQKSRSSAP
jgi:hypothetical protein